MIKTYSVKASEIKREWHLIDAEDKVLGRLSTQIANLMLAISWLLSMPRRSA